MKLKKILAISMSLAMSVMMISCGGNKNEAKGNQQSGEKTK